MAGETSFTLAGQNGCSQHIVCQAMGHFCNHIGGCRGNQAEIGGLGNRNVLYLKLKVAVKGIYETFVSVKLSKVMGLIKFVAFWVIKTWTWHPCL